MQKIALIPAYEPGEELPEITRRLCVSGFLPVVVDDGSGEAYLPVFCRAGFYASLLTHEKNRGKGRALKTGLSFIREEYPDADVIVTLDADGQHSVEDALRVSGEALRSRGALVLGCRNFENGVPARSFLGNSITRLVYRLSTGRRVSDTQTGLRAFTPDLIPFLLSVEGERYEYEMNVLLECSRREIPMKEVPIQTIYLDGNSASHFNTLRDSFRVYREIFKFAASSFIGFITDYGVYSLLAYLTTGLGAPGIPISNISARAVSAAVNFTINRKLVFKSEVSPVKAAAQYFTLAACILAGNTLLLSYLVNDLGANRYLAKLLTEVTFFSVSWIVQKFVIFRKKRPADGKTGVRTE
ncbi:Putative flippase GtrA (transmembrane translocase of bactoprenol-linked glucose) [Papillibacter cinnamivorans DSM 12816]|uniref:Putative flippase GtrA (Transmembrane translocase of bactoprenol-linked glucose) n=2 Tax=Papillibacter TaxID=100175 RepID=A0A1W1YDF4_9FIRM|nr:Putative flippase GtrA (transmembrane translocase of bactoprenol-linked glucose) [Papillibacter cinnamivorans DSM 12816]